MGQFWLNFAHARVRARRRVGEEEEEAGAEKKTERESAAAAAELAIKSLPPPLFSPSWKPSN